MVRLRVLVCGGRNYDDSRQVERVLMALQATSGIGMIIEGGAMGADALAALWAAEHEITLRCFPAEWGKYGRGAGPIRNQQMIDEGRPELVVAFPGGRGTANMVALAREIGRASCRERV